MKEKRIIPTPQTQDAIVKSNGQWSFVLKELCQNLERENTELQELVDGAYSVVELSYKPEGEYNKKWRIAWMEKAKRLVPGCDSMF